eukprot:CAMPEP_0181346348 /NCGR_PEP_ID=MMETSP1101-20121128/33279_1 /TAXON_ID=46948 /ORGANISM="Rhodomonas abbreviata, Strain Caron Lab Isolate" /LENGTH=183 /DNA_ID=CAMNT_0023458453 /DNA_START=1456 /DNA_END=2008 /DNA_ORIENTATION=+
MTGGARAAAAQDAAEAPDEGLQKNGDKRAEGGCSSNSRPFQARNWKGRKDKLTRARRCSRPSYRSPPRRRGNPTGTTFGSPRGCGGGGGAPAGPDSQAQTHNQAATGCRNPGGMPCKTAAPCDECKAPPQQKKGGFKPRLFCAGIASDVAQEPSKTPVGILKSLGCELRLGAKMLRVDGTCST